MEPREPRELEPRDLRELRDLELRKLRELELRGAAETGAAWSWGGSCGSWAGAGAGELDGKLGAGKR